MYFYVWTLNKDISAGEKVTKADLDQKKLWVSELDYMDLSMDIRQIMGKRAKTDLKKDTVVKADLLYQKKKQKDAAER